FNVNASMLAASLASSTLRLSMSLAYAMDKHRSAATTGAEHTSNLQQPAASDSQDKDYGDSILTSGPLNQ
ncbi:MAG: hypothetical protein ACK56F_15970, partial [bacterium]